MSLSERKYNVTGRRGTKHSLTAKELYERVSKDSKSDYGWIASATELVRVCNEPFFPTMYSRAIKIMILNCFANLELQKEVDSNLEKTDEAAVHFCYHSLPGTDEEVIKVKQKYLTAIITAIAKYTKSEVRIPIHPGPTYNKMCEEWKKAKFDEYVSREEINFDELRKTLYDDFEKMIKTAEEAGDFEEDDAKRSEQLKNVRVRLYE